MTGIMYHNQTLYELHMLLLYREHYASRYRAIAQLIPAGATILDLCCGPAVLYTRYLRHKGVGYTGFDINDGFVARGRAKGIAMIRGDVAAVSKFPSADFVVMQASLYHFLPDGVLSVIEKMLEAAKQKVIIAEPVRNVSSSHFGWLARLGHVMTDAGSGPSTRRFNMASLATAMVPFAPIEERSFPIAGGREMVYVLRPAKNLMPFVHRGSLHPKEA
jgi:SAM-dependent methyltransferase